jgi:ribulose 1,5-bisphosphate carboxylase large subunit-like protein
MDIAWSGKLISHRETLIPIHFHILKKSVRLIGVDWVGKDFPGLQNARAIVTF